MYLHFIYDFIIVGALTTCVAATSRLMGEGVHIDIFLVSPTKDF